jgi:fimbrial chaperone protein
MRLHRTARGLLAGLLAACGPAMASGLQVAPTGLELSPAGSTQGLWLTNTGDKPMQAQVRVFHWTQTGGKDELSATRTLVASPPMLNLDPGGRQLVRIIRTGAPLAPDAAEDAFRVLVDELPAAAKAGSSGLQYVLRYSVPVFVHGVAATDAAAVAASLHWSLAREGDALVLHVRNDGPRHAQIVDASVLPRQGAPLVLSPGLLGYVLPGTGMRWPLQSAATLAGATLKARINGTPVDQALSLGDLPR